MDWPGNGPCAEMNMNQAHLALMAHPVERAPVLAIPLLLACWVQLWAARWVAHGLVPCSNSSAAGCSEASSVAVSGVPEWHPAASRKREGKACAASSASCVVDVVVVDGGCMPRIEVGNLTVSIRLSGLPHGGPM